MSDDGSLEDSGLRPADPPLSANANKRQLVKNFATGYVGLVANLLLSFILTPVVLRHLGTSDYGLWIAIPATAGYVGLLEGGVSTAAVQMVAEAMATGNRRRLLEIHATSRRFFLITGVLSMLAVACLIPFTNALFHPPSGSVSSVQIIVALTAITTLAGFLTGPPQALIFGGGLSSRSSIFGIILSVATQGGQLVVVLLGGGLVGIFGVSTATTVLTLFGTVVIARRADLTAPRSVKPTRATLRTLLQSGRRNLVVTLIGTLSYSLDAPMIGIIRPVSEVTPYDLGLSTANFARSGATAATNLLMPTFAHFAAVNDRERQFRLYARAILFSTAITFPVMVALIAFGEPLMRLWLGSVPSKTYAALVALNVVFLLQLPGHQSFIFLTGAGKNKLLARLAIGPAIVNFGLSIVATFYLGPIGPAIGSLPQVFFLEFMILPWLSCRQLDVSMSRYLREALAPALVPAVIAATLALILRASVGSGSELLAPFQSVVVCIVAWAVFLAVVVKTDPLVRDFFYRALSFARVPRRRP